MSTILNLTVEIKEPSLDANVPPSVAAPETEAVLSGVAHDLPTASPVSVIPQSVDAGSSAGKQFPEALPEGHAFWLNAFPESKKRRNALTNSLYQYLLRRLPQTGALHTDHSTMFRDSIAQLQLDNRQCNEFWRLCEFPNCCREIEVRAPVNLLRADLDSQAILSQYLQSICRDVVLNAVEGMDRIVEYGSGRGVVVQRRRVLTRPQSATMESAPASVPEQGDPASPIADHANSQSVEFRVHIVQPLHTHTLPDCPSEWIESCGRPLKSRWPGRRSLILRLDGCNERKRRPEVPDRIREQLDRVPDAWRPALRYLSGQIEAEEIRFNDGFGNSTIRQRFPGTPLSIVVFGNYYVLGLWNSLELASGAPVTTCRGWPFGWKFR